ncbi:tyrosine--tRNA ligase, partial [Candidatus Woesearchaeota archaeon]|nr:tyrosine--tRNA ligase [Candidatus Woesearchaeota archaeon]
AIFMTDTEAEVKRKLDKAYCPVKQADENPILEYCKYIIFEKYEKLEVKRQEKFGGNSSYESYDNLAADYSKGGIHPSDLKAAVAAHINELLEPVRQHFKSNSRAKKLMEQVRAFEVTR